MSHKYLSREWVNGRWKYTYATPTNQSSYSRDGSKTHSDTMHFLNESIRRSEQAIWDSKRNITKIKSKRRLAERRLENHYNREAHLRTAAGMKQQKNINQQKMEGVKKINNDKYAAFNYLFDYNQRRAEATRKADAKAEYNRERANGFHERRTVAGNKQHAATHTQKWLKEHGYKTADFRSNKVKIKQALTKAKKNVNSSAAKGKARLSKLISKK